LALLEQYPEKDWRALVGDIDVRPDTGAAAERAVEDEELTSFRL
jgi:hypothetical protein